MAPNQKELAKLAGVSTGTVSNVISGSTRVGERSRQKVLEAIKVLGYQPNLIARSLRTNRTHTLGIVVPDITIPFFPKIIRGAECAARERGYFLIMLDSEGSPEREADMMALLRAQRVEGVLLVTATSEENSPERLNSLMEHFPVVCLDRLPMDLDVDAVCVDGRGAAAMAVTHLIDMGHTRIACITGPQTLQNEKERLRGYKQALQKHGIEVLPSLIWNCGFDQQHAARICREGMQGPNRPTALFATNGVTGLATLRGLDAIGLTTPHDFAFVTFDEITAEDFLKPGVTSVVQPTYDMGYQAVEILLRRIGAGDTPLPHKKVRLPASLQIRDSSRLPHSGSPYAVVPVDRRAASR
ncbi:MAG TPA: LacI family DNA-binding transcriptional regulator [Granulicella sp.]